MKLIGAGLPRTATLTQKLALESLGFGPCYHMVNVLGDLSLVPRWRQALEGRGNWEEIFSGFQATVDWPGAFFYAELMQEYPDAKVLLSVRDGEAWERSMGETIWGVIYGDCLMHDMSQARCRVDQGWADYMDMMRAMWEKSGLLTEDDETGTGNLARAMERYNAEVKATVPADRLLVWHPSDGWGPLCEFLEVPVPEGPVPHVNDSSQFASRIIDAALEVLTRARQEEVGAGAHP